MVLQFYPIDAQSKPTMRSGKGAANMIGTTTKEYSAATAVFLLGNKETRWYSSSTQ